MDNEIDIELDLLIQQIVSSILIYGNNITVYADDNISTNFDKITEICIQSNYRRILTFYRLDTNYVIKTNIEVDSTGVYPIYNVYEYLDTIRTFLNDLDRLHMLKYDILKELIGFLLQVNNYE